MVLHLEFGGATVENVSGLDSAAVRGHIECAGGCVDPFNLEQNQLEQCSTFKHVHIVDGIDAIEFCSR